MHTDSQTFLNQNYHLRSYLMKLSCTHCGHIQNPEDSFCANCQQALSSPLELVERLERKHKNLQLLHDREFAAMEVEIRRVKELLLEKKREEGVEEIQEPDNELVEEVSVPVHIPEPSPIAVAELIKEQEESAPKPQPVHPVLQTPRSSPKERTPRQKTWLEIQLLQVLTPIWNTYSRYKDEGKLPIFFMTIAGIAAMLFGFGYLMQYTLQALGKYEDLVKVGAGFAVATMSVGIGFRLSGKGERFREYASGLISLGIILNYVMIYFLSDLGDFPTLSSTLTGFLLIMANTALAIYLALRFEVRMIAVLFLIGGAFAPFYLNSTEDGTWYYLYLWFLTVATCFVSSKIQWKGLRYLAFVVSTLLLEMLVFSQAPDALRFTVYYHLFAYLFLAYTFLDHLAIKRQWAKADVLILAANVTVFLWNLFHTYQTQLLTLGWMYLGNALVLAIIYAQLKRKLDRKVQLGFFAIIGTFVGFAVPALLNHALMGLFWSIEGLLLIYLGFLFRMEWVRKEGYLLMGIAFAKLGWQSLGIIFLWEQGIWHEGFLNYAVIGGLIAACWIWGQRFQENFVPFERKIFIVFREILPIWLASVYLIMIYQWMGETACLLAWIPAVGMMYWGKRFRTQISTQFGTLFYLLSLFVLGAYSFELYSAWNEGIWHMGLWAFLTMGAMMLGFWMWGKSQTFSDNPLARSVWKILHESSPLWLNNLFIILSFYFLGSYANLMLWMPAIALIYWGKRFDTISSSNIGIGLFLLDWLILAYQSLEIIVKWQEGIWHDGLLAYSVFGGLMLGVWLWGKNRSLEEDQPMLRIWQTFRELTPIWLSSLFYLFAWQYLGTWSFALSWIPLFGLIYWGKQFKTLSSITAGLMHLMMFIPAYYLSWNITESYHMSDQFWYAKIAMGGFMLCLWACKSFYQWQNLEKEDSYEIVQVLRVLFFCLLPLIFLGYVKRHYFEWMSAASWMSIGMAYGLFKWLKYEALDLEVKILSAGALILTIWQMKTNGMIAGVVIMSGLIYMEKAHRREFLDQSSFRFILGFFPFAISVLVSVLVYHLYPLSDIALPWACFSTILFLFLGFRNYLAVAQMHVGTGLAIAAIANFVGLGLNLLEGSTPAMYLSVMNLVLWGLTLRKRIKPDQQGFFSILWKTGLIGFQLVTVMTYVNLLVLLQVPVEGAMLSVLLVFHAIVLIFIAMKEKLPILNKLSICLFIGALLKVVFHDIRDFATAEKVAVLIVVGLLLLGGAYGYVRVKRYLERKEEELLVHAG